MKFGFINHAREVGELRKAFLLRHNISTIPFRSSSIVRKKGLEKGLIEDMFTYRKICSSQGTNCSGRVFTIFLTPEQLLENQARAVDLVVQACRQAKEWGAEVVGLGTMTAVVGSRGEEVNAQSPIPATTGNSLTVYTTLKELQEVVDRLQIDLYRQKVVVVGFPGSIALAVTRALLNDGLKLIAVGRSNTHFTQRFLADLDDTVKKNIEVTRDLSHALNRGRIIFCATSSGNIIDPDRLQPGSVVFDIAQPRDVIKKKKKREDVLIIDAGTVCLPKTEGTAFHYVSLPFLSSISVPIRVGYSRGFFIYNYSGLGPYYIPSCLAETIILALEERRESFSLGRKLDLEKIKEIGALGEKHGFIFDHYYYFLSFDKRISEENYERTEHALIK